MFENVINFFRKLGKTQKSVNNSKEAAKERLHLVLMQDRANVSADFLDLMRQEIIEVIKKYIEVDETAIDVRLTNKANEDGTTGAPALYANIPIVNIKNEMKKEVVEEPKKETEKKEEKIQEKSEGAEEIKEEKIESLDNEKEEAKEETEKEEKIEEKENTEEKNEDNKEETEG